MRKMLTCSVSSESIVCFPILTSIFMAKWNFTKQMETRAATHMQSVGTEATETHLPCFLGKHKVPHHTNCSTEPSSHVEIGKCFLRKPAASSPHCCPGMEQGEDKWRAEVQRPLQTATLTNGKTWDSCHPTGINHDSVCDNQVVLIYHTNPRSIHGRHNQICVSHHNTGRQWKKEKWDDRSQIKNRKAMPELSHPQDNS